MPDCDLSIVKNKRTIAYGREIYSADYFKVSQITLKEFIQKPGKPTNIADGNQVADQLLENGENISIQTERKLFQVILAVF